MTPPSLLLEAETLIGDEKAFAVPTPRAPSILTDAAFLIIIFAVCFVAPAMFAGA
jgi:hypothetical protein